VAENQDFLKDLNNAQRAAVEYCDGPSLVIAGAGSGKTRVLTYKIVYLLEHGYQPWEIMALTFTNKAANEMKERVMNMLGDDRAQRIWMGTFHSVFLRILRYEHEKIGFSANFTIYDAADSRSLLKSIVKELELDDKVYKPATVEAHISNAKNRLADAQAYVAEPANYQADLRSNLPFIGKIYQVYANRCRQANAMDFDDILLYTFQLFRDFPEVCTKYAERFRYILVDEYQDTNYAQHCIVNQLSKVHQRVCVVGDDAQSIYSFRGANIDNILTFKNLYPNNQLFKLEQNYRSTQNIVDAANSLIHKNTEQIAKTVFSEKEVGERIKVIETFSDVEEGRIVAQNILRMRRRDHADYANFAILYRTNAQSRIFEEELRKQGIPYVIYGGLSFYQRKEIKDTIAYLRLIVNPNDEEAFRRVVNYPKRGIGNTSVAKIIEAATANGTGVWEVVTQPLQYGLKLGKAAHDKLLSFRQLIDSLHEKSMSVEANVVATEMFHQSGLFAELMSGNEPEDVVRRENVEELMNGMQEFVHSRKEEDDPNVYVTDYLAEVSLLTDMDTQNAQGSDNVTLMTVHSAKGLEFDTVFVVGLEENLFPNQMAMGSRRQIEEERRLFYVAITRACRHCFLTYSKMRYRYGKMEFSNPSRFIQDIDPQYLDQKRPQGETANLGRNASLELPWMKRTFAADNTRVSRPVREAPQPAPIPTFSQKGNLRPLSQAERTSTNVQAAPATRLRPGQRIRHERFGVGVVEQIEGSGPNEKATIAFEDAGRKQLLLRYARYTIID